MAQSSAEYLAYQAAYREKNREAIRVKEREYYHRNKHWLGPLRKKRRGMKNDYISSTAVPQET